MEPTPLPENPFPEGAIRAAYDQCLSFEATASNIQQIHGCPPPIVCARILGHLLRLAPAGNGQGQLQREISLAENRSKLMELAGMYFSCFLRLFKRSSGRTPVPSEHPSRPSFEDAREYANLWMKECELDLRSARNFALRRDDNKCMLTGKKGAHVRGPFPVETAHIIPSSTNTKIEQGSEKRSHMAGAWAILSMFAHDTIIGDLAGDRIHRLENILSLNVVAHFFFDDLKLWLKQVEGAPHTYRVCVAYDEVRTHGPLPAFVSFSTATDLPLPSPEYLMLHALCCEVALMSGAAEYIEDIERRMEDIKVLAKDGSNVDLLMTALSLVAAC